MACRLFLAICKIRISKRVALELGETDCTTWVWTYKGHISQLDLLRKVPHQPAKGKRRSGLTILCNEPVMTNYSSHQTAQSACEAKTNTECIWTQFLFSWIQSKFHTHCFLLFPIKAHVYINTNLKKKKKERFCALSWFQERVHEFGKTIQIWCEVPAACGGVRASVSVCIYCIQI